MVVGVLGLSGMRALGPVAQGSNTADVPVTALSPGMAVSFVLSLWKITGPAN